MDTENEVDNQDATDDSELKGKNPILRALKNPDSVADAIRAYCYDCMGGHPSNVGTKTEFVNRIRDCDLLHCALWLHRPYQDGAEKAANIAAAETAAKQLPRLTGTGDVDLTDTYARNPQARRKALNAKCWQCIGGRTDAAPRKQISNCQCEFNSQNPGGCPLWPQRRRQKFGKDQEAL